MAGAWRPRKASFVLPRSQLFQEKHYQTRFGRVFEKVQKVYDRAVESSEYLANRLPRTPLKRLLLSACLVYIFFSLLSTSALSLRGWWRRAARDGNVVIILASNPGGGVMGWKGPNQWALEHDSILNKRRYTDLHGSIPLGFHFDQIGYSLDVKDMSTKKRYAHEWRESWEKVDMIRAAMRAHPRAEWFWWMDLTTYIMEPRKTVEKHVIEALPRIGTRHLQSRRAFNPLGIQDIPDVDYSEQCVALWTIIANWCNRPNLIVTQDCGGFNLGSFLIRRSEWTDRLLDIWWDPVFYEQKHQEWDHKEQDALSQAWVRSGTVFIPQKTINAFPPGACAEQAGDPKYFYSEKDRDFVVNMAGCEWGRDCLGEMRYYKALSEKLNRGWL